MLFVRRDLLANGRGRLLVFAASIVVAAAMLHAQGTKPPCCAEIPAAIPTGQGSAPVGTPNIATPAAADLLAASAPVAAPDFQFALPPGVAPEQGLQVKTIWVARAISVMFPEIKTIGGFRQDALKWHPNGLAIDVMIPNHHTDGRHRARQPDRRPGTGEREALGSDSCDLETGLLPGHRRTELDGGLRLRNRQPLRPRSYRHRRRRIPDRARNLLPAIHAPLTAGLIDSRPARCENRSSQGILMTDTYISTIGR